ncbi:MAG: glycoside hydrolase family 3 protein [Oscillospiraceae bacterium]
MKKLSLSLIAVITAMAFCGCTATISKPNTETAADTTISKTTISETAASEENNSETAAETTLEGLDFSSVDALLQSMTDEQKVGQIILGRFPSEGAANMMREYHLGGFTLYADDFKNEFPDTMAEKTEKIQAAAEIPAFLATDEEGGTVVRVSKFPQYRLSPFSSQIALARDGEEVVREENIEKAELLLSLGINFNLAPVADITESHSDYIYDRTFGENTENTSKYVAAAVEAMNEGNIASCLKHFPGYGSNVDTHTGSAADSRSRSSFENTDFLPFEAGIEAGAPAVMVNHNVVAAFDDINPASLSAEVHAVLRDELGFEGIILTDDLGMDAITEFAAEAEESPYVLAVNAGNDMLCTSDIESAYNDVLAALKDGRIDKEQLDESVRRILEMKEKYGILKLE